MKEIIQEGKSVEEAIALALQKLDLPREKVEIDVIEEGSRGLLGLIASKNASIRARVKMDKKEIACKFVQGACERLGLNVEVEIIEEQDDPYRVTLEIKGEDLGLIIGKRGQTIDALQYLATLVANKGKGEGYLRIVLDAEGYRKKREKTLASLAERMAKKALRSGRRVVLEPMAPQERRIIHLTLRDNGRVKTYSQGEEPYRKVVIEPVKTQ